MQKREWMISDLMQCPEATVILPDCWYQYNENALFFILPFDEQPFLISHWVVKGFMRHGDMIPYYFDHVSGYEMNEEKLRLGSSEFYPVPYANNPIQLRHKHMVKGNDIFR